MVGARSTGAVEPVGGVIPEEGINEQALKEQFYVAALQDDQFEHPGIRHIEMLDT
jgi:hypothetical protein